MASRTQIVAGAVALILAAIAFAPGLHGPFVLDDHGIIRPVVEWLQGRRSYADTITGGLASLAGRPLAMATLMANGAMSGVDTFGYKLFNLVLHLANAGLAFALLRRLAGVARALGGLLGIAAVAAWALHPAHANTVLYVVQRMTLLGAMSLLLAMLLYVEARTTLARDPGRARLLLFLGIPLVVAAGALAKEIAVLAPLFCLALEATVFAPLARPREIRAFHLAFIAVPVALLAAVALWHPWLLGDFSAREFTRGERLLTQPRVLMDYAATFFWPAPGRLALYRDGYAASTGAWQPPATLLAALACLGLLLAALWQRRARPLFALGIFWFFAGHLLEAGPIALELYFPHRNYLPSLGLVLAVAGLWPAARTDALAGMLLVLCLPLALLTWQRAQAWGDFDRHLAAEAPPGGERSRRLQHHRAARAEQRGDTAGIEAALQPLRDGTAGDRVFAEFWSAYFRCRRGAPVEPAQLQRMSESPFVVTHLHVTALDALADLELRKGCDGIDLPFLLARSEAWSVAWAARGGHLAGSKLARIRDYLRRRGDAGGAP